MKAPFTQRGSALVITLIFLVLMSLFAISAFNSTTSNLRIVGNTQVQQEATSAEEAALESVITAISQSMEDKRRLGLPPDFDPVAISANPIPVDINGDGTPDYTVNISPAPRCFRVSDHIPAISITKEGFPAGHPEAFCLGGGICRDTDWDFSATVTDAKTNTSVTVHQGMNITLLPNEASLHCPPTPP